MSDWISVTDRLPESGLFVVAAIIRDGVIKQWGKQRYSHSAKAWLDGSGYGYLATHWMPLPAPPKE